jgi:hypothetical protein
MFRDFLEYFRSNRIKVDMLIKLLCSEGKLSEFCDVATATEEVSLYKVKEAACSLLDMILPFPLEWMEDETFLIRIFLILTNCIKETQHLQVRKAASITIGNLFYHISTSISLRLLNEERFLRSNNLPDHILIQLNIKGKKYILGNLLCNHLLNHYRQIQTEIRIGDEVILQHLILNV